MNESNNEQMDFLNDFIEQAEESTSMVDPFAVEEVAMQAEGSKPLQPQFAV